MFKKHLHENKIKEVMTVLLIIMPRNLVKKSRRVSHRVRPLAERRGRGRARQRES